MPLRYRGAILQPATASGGVAPQLPRDRRRRPSDPTRYPLYSAALHPQERNLLAFSKRKISSRLQLRRRPKHCWWHSACLSKPPRSDRLRDVAGGEASSVDKPAAIAVQNLLSSLRPAVGGRPSEGNGALPERSDRRLHLVIEAPHEALRRPLESAQYVSIKYTERL